MPSILMVGNFLSGSVGTKSVCEELSERFPEIGFETITTSDKRNPFLRLSDMVRTTWTRRNDYAIAQVDVFSGKGFVWAESVARTLRAARKPFVLSLHGGNLPVFARRWPGRVRRLLASADAVTTPSDYLRQSMSSFRPDIVRIPNPIDISRYLFRERTNPDPVLIWIRAFHECYNPQLVPRVAGLLKAEFPAVRAFMVGPDKGDGTLVQVRALVRELGVGENVEIVGSVPKAEIPDWLGRGDIFLNTSRIDNAPVTVLEALACGVPVVSTNVGGVPFLVTDGVDADLVDTDDAPAMAAAVRRLLRDPERAARLSRGGRATALSNDWADVLPRWKDLLRNVLARSARG